MKSCMSNSLKPTISIAKKKQTIQTKYIILKDLENPEKSLHVRDEAENQD